MEVILLVCTLYLSRLLPKMYILKTERQHSKSSLWFAKKHWSTDTNLLIKNAGKLSFCKNVKSVKPHEVHHLAQNMTSCLFTCVFSCVVCNGLQYSESIIRQAYTTNEVVTNTVISSRWPAPVIFCQNEKKDSADYPHWQITCTKKQKKVMLNSSRTHKFEVIERD